MKKNFFSIFTFIIFTSGFGQNNAVQNLQWRYYYDHNNYRDIFSLSWEEPITPHNELIGYNIYRDNQLYKFQTTKSVGCNPDWGITNGCDFLTHSFTVFVKAVYGGNIESEDVSYIINGPSLNTESISLKPFTIAPNPVKNVLVFSEEVSTIKITELSGKVIKQISTSKKSIDTSKLAKGTYIITATTKTGELINKKFIKE